ncbi:tyrosine-type recombinase/integrase [Paenibacillus paeoniae]|nr:tyrosine-type recombinase/integrase [Paenibacillus paeoniae]
MPIEFPTSPMQNLRLNIQQLVATYGIDGLQEILGEFGLGVDPTKTPNNIEDISGEAVEEYFLKCPRFISLSPDTRTTYKSELTQFFKFSKPTPTSTATLRQLAEPKNIVEYLNKYEPRSNTRAKKASFLRTFFRTTLKHFFNEKIEEIKPLLELKTDESDIPKALKVDQLREVVHLAAAKGNGFRNFTIIMTFLSSAIRLNELLQLKFGDIDSERQIIQVVAKGRKGAKRPRTINLLGLSILKNYIKFTYQSQIHTFTEEQLDQLHVFSTDGGRSAMSPRSVQYIVKNLINMATSIPKKMKDQYSVHTFRHCYAVYGLESGIDIYTLSKLLGHESIETTTIYLKLFDDQLKRAVENHPFANGLNKGDSNESFA